MYDIIIKDGMVVDGSGNKPCKADVAIENGKIAFIGNAEGMTLQIRTYPYPREHLRTPLIKWKRWARP